MQRLVAVAEAGRIADGRSCLNGGFSRCPSEFWHLLCHPMAWKRIQQRTVADSTATK
jgi:hypothetical protein